MQLIKPFVIGLAGGSLLLLSASCGSSKMPKASYPEYTSAGNTGTRVVTKVKEELDECQIESMNEPSNEIRAYGSAIDEDRDFALHQAVLSAKASMVDRLQSSVLNVMKRYRAKMQTGGKTANDDDVAQDIASFAERELENCRIICSNRYRLSDGTYECSVCISIPANKAEMISGAAVLSDDERLGLQFREQEFRNSYKDELDRFRQQQKERR